MPGRPDDSSLRLKKQQFVRSEIWNTAVDLFAQHGYDRTTIDDIATAAGVSRRTFFRYFASKDDVMVQATDTYGDLLVDAVKESAGAAPLQIVEGAVRRLAAFVVLQPRARLAMQIVLENPSARGAQLSEYSVITERVAEAFAAAGAAGGRPCPDPLGRADVRPAQPRLPELVRTLGRDRPHRGRGRRRISRSVRERPASTLQDTAVRRSASHGRAAAFRTPGKTASALSRWALRRVISNPVLPGKRRHRLVK